MFALPTPRSSTCSLSQRLPAGLTESMAQDVSAPEQRMDGLDEDDELLQLAQEDDEMHPGAGGGGLAWAAAHQGSDIDNEDEELIALAAEYG